MSNYKSYQKLILSAKMTWNIKSVAAIFIVSVIIFSAIFISFADTLPPPRNIGAEALCNPAVNIYWKAPNGQVKSYNIENVGVWNPKNTTSTGYADKSVSMDKYYIYDVTAVYSQGESEPSSIFIKTPSEDECENVNKARKEQSCPYSSDAANNKYALEFDDGLWSGAPTGPTIPVSMPAGRYKVSLVSFDGGTKRIKTYQPNEQWYVSLKNSNGVEIAKTSTNTDLRDYVEYDYKNEVVNESLTVNSCVASAQSLWGGGWDDESAGSVYGICAYFEKLDGPGNSCQLNQNSNSPVSITSFTATPNTINSGSSSTLEWTTVNAVSCVASSGWSGTKSVNGSQSTGPLAETTTYTLQCSDIDGVSDTKSATVNVLPINTITSINCQPSPKIANIGQDVTWTVVPIPASGSYTYSWSGDDNLSGSSQSVIKSYSTTGSKKARVDIGGASNPQQCTGTVRVTASPLFNEF